MRHLNAAAAILGTFLLMALVRRYFWELWFERQQKSPAPKFLSQLLSLLIFLGTLMLVMSLDYGQDLTAFVFGSTVVVGILGFAMQDLLGNIISGIALEIGKPFRIGDWLFIDNQYAEVMEVNWRSTRLRTNDDIQLDLPNKTVAGAILTNLSHPTRQHAARVRVGFEYEVPPNAIKEALSKAAARAHGVLLTPPPKVYLRDYGDSSAIYEVKFWIDNQALFNEICDAVRTNIWYEAHRRGFRFPFPTRTLHLEKKPPARPIENLQAALLSLRKQPFLKCLDEGELEKVLSHARPLHFGAGEKVIEQGESGDSMFFLSRGQAEVFLRPAEARHDTLIAELKQGDCFGEMSLLTGEPRSATVVAKRDCEVWEIQQTVMAEVLHNNQALVQTLGELLAQRRLEIEGALAANLNRTELNVRQSEYTQSFLEKLYSVFEL
jgi:small-conductance mechanosensitive channel/CRP-like cAMP-binding protein